MRVGSLQRGSLCPERGSRRPPRPFWLSLSGAVAVFAALGLCLALAFLTLHSFSIAVFFKNRASLESDSPGWGPILLRAV